MRRMILRWLGIDKIIKSECKLFMDTFKQCIEETMTKEDLMSVFYDKKRPSIFDNIEGLSDKSMEELIKYEIQKESFRSSKEYLDKESTLDGIVKRIKDKQLPNG